MKPITRSLLAVVLVLNLIAAQQSRAFYTATAQVSETPGTNLYSVTVNADLNLQLTLPLPLNYLLGEITGVTHDGTNVPILLRSLVQGTILDYNYLFQFVSPSNATSEVFTMLDTNGLSQPLTLVLTPQFMVQPTNAWAFEGSNATFSAQATYFTGYQWQKNGTNLAESSHCIGVTNSTLVITNVTAADSGAYTVVAESPNSPLTSSNAMLTAMIISPFFQGQIELGEDLFYLAEATNHIFGYYALLDAPVVYHFDLGYEYFIDAGNPAHGVYMYDFLSKTFFYTEPGLFPYLYDFTLNAWLYYYPDTNHPGHYTTNPRYFYNFNYQQIFSK